MEVDWGGKIKANHKSECLLSDIDWGAHETHTSGYMLSEVDWGAHDSSFFLHLVHIDHDGEPKDFFTQELWGTTAKKLFHSSHGVPENSLDSGLTEDGVFNFQSIKEHRGSYSLSDPEYLGSSHNLLIEWEHGEITWEPLTMADVNHQEKFKVTLAMVLVELHNLQQWGANVGNAYLQVLTKEKLYIVAGPEFEDSQGHA